MRFPGLHVTICRTMLTQMCLVLGKRQPMIVCVTMIPFDFYDLKETETAVNVKITFFLGFIKEKISAFFSNFFFFLVLKLNLGDEQKEFQGAI